MLFYPKLFLIPSLFIITTISAKKPSYIEEILRESLRSNRVQACDGERITLSCPRNTQIIVQTGFYGRVVPESQLCPPPENRKNKMASFHSTTCDVIQAHTRISQLCDKRRKCAVVVDSHTFDDDPCPSTSKYLQMSYTCMPVSFEDETFCMEKEIRLECRQGRRLAVYSAQMKTSQQCTKSAFINECSTDVLADVLKQCHAQDSCTLNDLKTNCEDASLHIVYMCVNEEIFSEEAIKGELNVIDEYLKKNEESKSAAIIDHFDDADRWERIVETPVETSSPPVVHMINNDASYVTHDEYRMEPPGEVEQVEPNLVGVGHDLIQVANFFKENKDKVLTCIVLSISMAAIVLLSACIVKKLCTGGTERGRQTRRRGRSIETSRLVSSNYGGTLTPVHLCDVEDETYMRYSLGSSKPNSHLNYDF